MSGRGNGVWSLAGEIILRNYKSWKVEWRPLEIKLWLFRVITWHFCLSLFSSDREFSRQNKWRLNGDLSLPHILASVRGWRANYTANTQELGSFHSTQVKSHQQIIFLHLSPDSSDLSRTFLQINCCWFLILAVIVIDSQITEEKAHKLLSDWVEEKQQKHPDFNIWAAGLDWACLPVSVVSGNQAGPLQ